MYHQFSSQGAQVAESLIARAGAVLMAGKDPADRPRSLSHFTDFSGLVGILEHKTLWASLASSMNDPSEVIYGVQAARDLLKGDVLNLGTLPADRVEELLDRSKAVRRWGMEWRTYVVSFCAAPDTALHWLHYGRSGSGVAISFDPGAIDAKPFDLFPVLYDFDQQGDLLRGILGTIDEVLTENLPTIATLAERKLLIRMASDLAANYVWMAAPRLKSNAFSGEQEWRLITYEPKGEGVPPGFGEDFPTSFRSAAGRVIPYKKFVFDPGSVLGVSLGFSSSVEPDDPALAILMEESFGTRVPISKSSVPVRP